MGVPLAGASASGEEDVGVLFVGLFYGGAGGVEDELGALVGCVVFAVGEEAALVVLLDF